MQVYKKRSVAGKNPQYEIREFVFYVCRFSEQHTHLSFLLCTTCVAFTALHVMYETICRLTARHFEILKRTIGQIFTELSSMATAKALFTPSVLNPLP